MVRGYDVVVREASTTSAALDAVRARPPEVVFTDHLSPTDTAFSTIGKLRDIGYDGPIVVVTGHGDKIRRRQLLAAGAVAVLDKDELDSRLVAQTLADLSVEG